jgi:hypothetical protein
MVLEPAHVLRSLDRDSQGQNEDTANENEGSVIEQQECSVVHRNEPDLLRHFLGYSVSPN